MVQRAADLKTIKALVEGLETAAPGTEGARCEKALSNGTFRPARGAGTCEGENVCCGAARVPITVGKLSEGWMTIETCGSNAAGTKYQYSPPRPPMQTTATTAVPYDFTCIAGAKKLAAAAGALATAVYMLA